MKIKGSFKDLTDAHSYFVSISNSDAHGTESYEVDNEAVDGTHVWWGDKPVVIETKCDDWADVIVPSKATVNLVTDGMLSGLYASAVTDTEIEIRCDGGLLFKGYVEPRAYTQEFSDESNGVMLNCVDGLTAMQYYPFRNVRTHSEYLKALAASKQSSMTSLLSECFQSGCGSMPIYYDQSKKYPGASVIFDALYVNEALYLGSDYDNVKSCYNVVEDILKYLGLHVLETCGGIYIFSRESLGKSIDWSQIGGTLSYTEATWQWSGGTLSNDHLGGTDGSIDIGEVFNQVALTISPSGDSTVLKSPLDSSGTIPALGGRVKYMTEYAADGDGKRAAVAFWNLIKSGADINNYDGNKVWKDWYVRPMRNLYWKMGHGMGPGSTVTDLVSLAQSSPLNGSSPFHLVDNLATGMNALLVSTGTVDHKPGTGDTSKQSTLSMTTELVISVNGNASDSAPSPSDESIQGSIPLASYSNGDATAVFSPSDPGQKNYLVFAGSLVLCPIMANGFTFDVDKVRTYDSGYTFYDWYASSYGGFQKGWKAGIMADQVPSRDNGDGRYLSFEWWNGDISQGSSHKGWIPYTDDGPQEYEYKTSDGKDAMEKFDVLWCMLRIGDKVLVEDKSKSGGLDAFSWAAYKTLSDCGNNVDEYLKQTFTIGVDPKIGDKMIGQQFQIGTNFDYTTNISADGGMAIPLPYDAHLHGELTLEILGVDNGPWENYHKTRHATMFRHSKWDSETIPLMAHVSAVVIQNLSVKFYSDGENSDEDTDIVYLSRADSLYSNKKEITGSAIHSGFTSAEVNAYNLNDKILRSTVCDGSGQAVLSVEDSVRGESGKPEKLYVDELWQRLHVPRVTLSQTVCPALVSPWESYSVDAVGKTLHVLSWKSNLADGTCKVTLTE